MAACVVPAEVVVVPGGEYGGGAAEGLVFGLGSQLGILGAEHVHVVGVAIYIIAEIDEEIGAQIGYLLEDGLRFGFLSAGTEGNEGARGAGGLCHLGGAGAAIQCEGREEDEEFAHDAGGE